MRSLLPGCVVLLSLSLLHASRTWRQTPALAALIHHSTKSCHAVMLSQHVPSASSTAFSNSFCSYLCTCSVTSEPQVGIPRRQCLLTTHSCRPLNKARLQPRHRLSKSAKYANKASASNSQGAAASLTVRSPAAPDQQHDPQHTGSSELFTPLTKAHKPAKAAAAIFPPIRLQQAGRAAAIAALAVGAGAAMTALAVDVTDAAITGAVLAAGMSQPPCRVPC